MLNQIHAWDGRWSCVADSLGPIDAVPPKHAQRKSQQRGWMLLGAFLGSTRVTNNKGLWGQPYMWLLQQKETGIIGCNRMLVLTMRSGSKDLSEIP